MLVSSVHKIDYLSRYSVSNYRHQVDEKWSKIICNNFVIIFNYIHSHKLGVKINLSRINNSNKMPKTNNSSMSGYKDTNVPNIQTKIIETKLNDSPGFKPAAVWESPYAEELSLCMEVTAYVHQWD